jgi:peptidoglycan/xylan/chitin deacetylase (PgdA/CDA1 family)
MDAIDAIDASKKAPAGGRHILLTFDRGSLARSCVKNGRIVL